MDLKGWSGLDTRQWWFGVLLIAGPALIGAVSTGRNDVAIIVAGVVTWAFGEWIQHPYQQFKRDGYIGNSYHRIWSVGGTALDIIGIGLIALGAYRIWKFGGPII